MSKLVLFAVVDGDLLNGVTTPIECAFRDAATFSTRIGEQIIIADVNLQGAERYVALGHLASFGTDASGRTFAEISQIQLFPAPVTPFEDMLAQPGVLEVADEFFDQIISIAVGNLEEETAVFDRVSPPAAILKQLRRQQANKCSFSGVFTADGRAYPIWPPDEGGKLHASNYLFLDPEPGTAFLEYAWSLGPNLEILINASAVAPGMAETISRGGKLALSRAISALPDSEALDWHRAKFVSRLTRKEVS